MEARKNGERYRSIGCRSLTSRTTQVPHGGHTSFRALFHDTLFPSCELLCSPRSCRVPNHVLSEGVCAMKLPVYKPGTVKKALVAFAGIGVTGAVIKYKSHTQGQLEGGLEDFPEDHGLSWYLQVGLMPCPLLWQQHPCPGQATAQALGR